MQKFKSQHIKIFPDFKSVISVPVFCPYCGNPNHPAFKKSTYTTFNNKSLVLSVFNVECCNKNILTTHLEKESKGDIRYYDFLCSYPNTLAATLPEKIISISPRFVSLYNQAHTAEYNGHFELAGCGYRNAMEVLIKDYAINALGQPSENVIKAKLFKAIENYLPTVNLKNCADVIRFLGNDYTHYISRYESIEFEQLKKYLTLFIFAIDAELSMREPIILTGRTVD
jgi:hypothetical protein